MSDRDWTLRVTPTEAGVRLELDLADLHGAPVTAAIAIDRAEARRFARAMLAAAGDATERTFPHPPAQDQDAQDQDQDQA